MRSFKIINGAMLGFAFGSAGLALLATDFVDRSPANPEGQATFARLVRSEKKTFFGFKHYYFTCLVKQGPREIRFTEAVRSELYNLKREGDNIEVLVFPDDHVQLRPNDRPVAPASRMPLLGISALFTSIALILLFLPDRRRE